MIQVFLAGQHAHTLATIEHLDSPPDELEYGGTWWVRSGDAPRHTVSGGQALPSVSPLLPMYIPRDLKRRPDPVETRL
ncbi:MAG: hypothetical protein J0I43_02025 [Microbacterium sp.]|uniref:hypothetical protein n=1 Tax=Microbacterium sp. TaxID=51671 RepID=UPI001AD197DD|nr:hypothetical protein [Microbacterium sp.]MBN9176136.1 hypothetical protein [Microbacterium sp.]